mmetsp:Transcript_5792/g.15442  ORF Transcript_5792/g.15442 Transcript_5792/m.15442 type:complete len:642 (+) Transcript_5792:83-2008(+)
MRNINVGVLGHVDSGKTALVRALSTALSTAALDKHPQAQRRGITLDLGFSCFETAKDGSKNSAEDGAGDGAEHGAEDGAAEARTRVTLVDCPGHASLLRMVLGAAHIIDVTLLVVDARKLVEPQTAECLALAEILFSARSMVIALNKIDLLSSSHDVDRVVARLRTALRHTPCFAASPIVPVSATAATDAQLQQLRCALCAANQSLARQASMARIWPRAENDGRDSRDDFVMSVDHVFANKGHGVVMAGTILSGCVSVRQLVEVPLLGERRRVKTLETFHREVACAQSGARVALAVGADASRSDETSAGSSAVRLLDLERAVIAAPSLLRPVQTLLICAHRVRFHRFAVRSRQKYHISVGHATVQGVATFFAELDLARSPQAHTFSDTELSCASAASRDDNYLSGLRCLQTARQCASDLRLVSALFHELGELPSDPSGEDASKARQSWILGVIELERPVVCPEGGVVLGARLDLEVSQRRVCRLAFCGRSLTDGRGQTNAEQTLSSHDAVPRLRCGAIREQNNGVVERVLADSSEVIVRGLLNSKHSSIEPFLSMRVWIYLGGVPADAYSNDGAASSRLQGTIARAFGKSGKVVVSLCRSDSVRGHQIGNIQAGDAVSLSYVKLRAASAEQASRIIQLPFQ